MILKVFSVKKHQNYIKLARNNLRHSGVVFFVFNSFLSALFAMVSKYSSTF